MQREVGVNVEHAAVVVAHHAQTVVLHGVRHPRRVEPFADFAPRGIVILNHAGDLEERNLAAAENVGDFRNGACLAPCQPLAGHPAAILHGVEGGVIDGLSRGEIQDDDGHFGPAHHGEHGGRQGVSGDVQEEQVDVGPAEGVAGLQGFFRGIDHAEVDDLDVRAPQAGGDALDVFIQAAQEPFELRPIGIEADGEQADAQRGWGTGGHRRTQL